MDFAAPVASLPLHGNPAVSFLITVDGPKLRCLLDESAVDGRTAAGPISPTVSVEQPAAQGARVM